VKLDVGKLKFDNRILNDLGLIKNPREKVVN